MSDEEDEIAEDEEVEEVEGERMMSEGDAVTLDVYELFKFLDAKMIRIHEGSLFVLRDDGKEYMVEVAKKHLELPKKAGSLASVKK
jgi:hypothetical protein